jgi:hypothetical protein
LYSVYLIADKVVVTTKHNVNLLSLGTEHQGRRYRLLRSTTDYRPALACVPGNYLCSG